MQKEQRILIKDALSSVEDIDAALSGAADDYHGSATEYIVRVSPQLFLAISRPQVCEPESAWGTVATRLKGKSLILIPVLPTIPESIEAPELLDCVDMPLLRLHVEDSTLVWSSLQQHEVAAIRQHDLEDVVRSQSVRSVLTVADGHFQLPSGAHTTHFVRLAECFSDMDTVDRVVHWIAREVATDLRTLAKEQLALVVDNPSTLVIALRLAQLFPTARIACQCLASYPESAEEEGMREWLESRLPNDCVQLICIVSVSSTGALANLLSRACSTLGVKSRCALLYATTDDERCRAFCRIGIDHYQHFSSEEECSFCKENSPVFQIDRARYFLHERKIDTVPLPIRLFEPQREFLVRYGARPGVLVTHVDDPNDSNPRHHAFYISVNALLNDVSFREELTALIETLPCRPDLVVIPPHPVGSKIGQFLGELGYSVRYHHDLRLNLQVDGDAALAAEISAASSLLIVDDLAFSGSRLRAFSRSLRESAEDFTVPECVVFLPILDLCESDETWGKICRGLESNHPGQRRFVRKLYSVRIPNWTKELCPWCAEQKELERAPAMADMESDRRAALLLDQDGISGDNWVSRASTARVPAFGDHSPILPAGATPMQVLFACAAAVQHARTIGPLERRLNPHGFPRSVLLDASVVQHFQTETLLVIALLRVLKANELAEAARVYLREATLNVATGQMPYDTWALRELILAQRRGVVARFRNDADRDRAYDAAEFSQLLPAAIA